MGEVTRSQKTTRPQAGSSVMGAQRLNLLTLMCAPTWWRGTEGAPWEARPGEQGVECGLVCVSGVARTPFPCNVAPSHPRVPRTILTSLQRSLHPAIYTLA